MWLFEDSNWLLAILSSILLSLLPSFSPNLCAPSARQAQQQDRRNRSSAATGAQHRRNRNSAAAADAAAADAAADAAAAAAAAKAQRQGRRRSHRSAGAAKLQTGFFKISREGQMRDFWKIGNFSWPNPRQIFLGGQMREFPKIYDFYGPSQDFFAICQKWLFFQGAPQEFKTCSTG